MNLVPLKHLLIIPFIYLIFCLIIYYSQHSLLYFPNIETGFNKQTWNSIVKNNKFLGLETIDNYTKTILIFHGNSGNANTRNYYQSIFPNYHIIVAEYPGYGNNKDLSISKKSLIDYARQITRYTQDNFRNNFIIVGESLGTGIASQMATEFDIDKLIMITPYSSIANVAQSKFWYLPAHLIVKDNYNSVLNLQNYTGKSLFIIAEHDQVIPANFAIDLYNQIHSPKNNIFIINAGHNNWFEYMTAEQKHTLYNFL